MEESILDDRYASLKHYIQESFKRMKKDGLALQLEKHYYSSKFTANRLVEVLGEFIDVGRERFMQKLIEDIEEAEMRKDKIIYKYKRAMKKNELTSNGVISENKKLSKRKLDLTQNINELNQKIKHISKSFKGVLSEKEARIAKTTKLISESKNTLSLLKIELDALKFNFKIMKDEGVRYYSKARKKVKKTALTYCYDSSMLGSYVNRADILKKEEELKYYKDKVDEVKKALSRVVSITNGIAAGIGIKERIDENAIDSYNQVLQAIVNNQEQNAIMQHLEESTTDIPNVTKNPLEFVDSVRDTYESALREKENRLNEILRQAKNRRQKLQKEILEAGETLKALNETSITIDFDILDELQRSHQEFENTTHMLDQTLNKLTGPSNSTNIFSNISEERINSGSKIENRPKTENRTHFDFSNLQTKYDSNVVSTQSLMHSHISNLTATTINQEDINLSSSSSFNYN